MNHSNGRAWLRPSLATCLPAGASSALVKSPRLRFGPTCLLLAATAAAPAWAANALASCQAGLQRISNGNGGEDALRACVPLFRESGCQLAWKELLDTPRASPGYGRGASVARLEEACVKAYCRFPGMGRQQLCTGKTPPPLTAEFFGAWKSFQGAALHPEHVSSPMNERLVHALVLWAGFSPRPGTRNVLQAVTRPDVPGVVALTLWSAHGERLGAWVTDVVPDEVTLLGLQEAVPPPPGEPPPTTPCVRLEASGALPSGTAEALLKVLRSVCPAEMVTVNGV
jgi:hypothetical protein